MPRASVPVRALASAALTSVLACGCSSSSSSGGTSSDAGHRSDATTGVDASTRRDAGDAASPGSDASYASDAASSAQGQADVYVPVGDFGCGSAAALVPGGCGDPTNDPHNCGSCGHDCDGGACFDATCGPMPEGVLATGQYGPTALFVDGENAYWRNVGDDIGSAKAPFYVGSQIMKCSLSGCGNRPTPLGPADRWWRPRTVALDDTSVYWTSGGSVLSCPKAGCGCAPKTVLAVDTPEEITVHGSTLYFTGSNLTNVGSCPVTGCGTNPTLLAERPIGPQGIAADDTSVFWTTESWGVLSCGLGGCDAGPETLWFPMANQTNTTGIAVDASNVYWTNGVSSPFGTVMQCAKTDCGGTLVTLATGRDWPTGVAVDGADVYWAEESAFVKCAIGGCGGAPTTLATTQGIAVAVDAKNVYMAQQASPTDGWIVMQPK